MNLPIIHILPENSKRFLQGYPWIYANELKQDDILKSLAPGALVQVQYKNKTIATGYFNKHSLIAFRELSRVGQEQIDVAFFLSRLELALKARSIFYPNPFYRLVHAEADYLPGLIIDRFADVLVLQANTQGMVNLLDPLIKALEILLKPKTIYLKNDSNIRTLEGLAIAEPTILGQEIDKLKVIENSIEFSIDILHGQKTGWFFDQQENHQLLAKLAKNKTVIDYFCYSGGFSIAAAKAGAVKVLGIDRSEQAIQNARTAAKINQVETVCEFLVAETFVDMEKRIAENLKYDMVILDPPAFVKSKKDLMAGLKGYEKLLSFGLKLVNKQGLLAITSCSYHVKEMDLKQCLAKALQKNQMSGRILKTLGAGPDHPLHPMLDESAYLKGFLLALN